MNKVYECESMGSVFSDQFKEDLGEYLEIMNQLKMEKKRLTADLR